MERRAFLNCHDNHDKLRRTYCFSSAPPLESSGRHYDAAQVSY